MASASTQTVFGYGCSLDWRPTSFTSPFPSTRLCSVCGLVPPATATLPCRHVLCQLCFDSFDGDCHGRKRCPLDKELFQEEDVVWSTHSKNSVLSRQVRCWNAGNGCDAEDSASAMLNHFTNTCRFHAVNCSTCGGSVLHRDFANHFESGCVPTSCRNERPLSENFANAFVEVKDALRKISQENVSQRDGAMALLSTSFNDAMTTAVERIKETCRASLADHLREVSAAVRRQQADNERTMKELLTAEFNQNMLLINAKIAQAFAEGCDHVHGAAVSASSSTSSLVSNLTREINDFVEDLSVQPTLSGEDAARGLQLLAAAALSVKNNALENPQPCMWTLYDWDDFCLQLGGRGRQKRRDRFGGPYYFGGRLVVPRLCYYPNTNEVQFRPYIIRGLYDEFLGILDKAVELRFIHPTDSLRDVEFQGHFYWERPGHKITCMGSEVLYVGHNSLPIGVSSLEDGGFITNNKVELQVFQL